MNDYWEKQWNNFQIKCILRIERCYTICHPPCLPTISTFRLHQSSRLPLISSLCLQEMQEAINLQTEGSHKAIATNFHQLKEEVMEYLHWQRLKTRKRNEIVKNKRQFMMWNDIEASCGMQVCVWAHGGVWDCPHSIADLQRRGVIMQTTQNKEPRESMQAMSPSNIHTSLNKLTPLMYFPSLY